MLLIKLSRSLRERIRRYYRLSMCWSIPPGQHDIVVPENDITVRKFDYRRMIRGISDSATNRHGKNKLDGRFCRVP